MKIKGVIWLGTRTSNFEAMVHLYRNIMGLDITYQEPGFVVLDLPNGDRVEVFGDDSSYNPFFTTPVAGFLVDDIESARIEMEAQASNLSVRSRGRTMAMPGVTSARQMGLFMN